MTRRCGSAGRGGFAARLAFAAAIAGLPAGCAALPGASPAPAPPAAEARLGPEEVAARIAALEAALPKGKAGPRDAAAARELALLYVHPANPAPDHGKSLEMMRAYRSLAPGEAEGLETARIVALLEAVDRLGRLLREAKDQRVQLAGQVKALQQGERDAKKRELELLARAKTLQDRITMLEDRIEKLQALDLEMEKRRRSVR